MGTEKTEPRTEHGRQRRKTGGTGQALAWGALAVLAATTAVLAWSRPTSTPEVARYSQAGALSYGALVPAGSVYGSNGLRTGQPIYTSAVKALDMSFTYRFRSAVPASVSGTAQLVVAMDNGQGVTRQLLSTPVTTFRGDEVDLRAVLDMSAVKSLAMVFDQADGTLGEDYMLTVSPSVNVHGQIAGSALSTRFDPEIKFAYASATLVPSSAAPSPASAGGAASGAGMTGDQASSGLASTTSGSVVLSATRPTTFLFHDLTAAEARAGSLVLLALALAFGVAAGRPLLHDATSGHEPLRIGTRYGSMLVEVESLPHAPGTLVVDLASFAGLVQVARRLECPLLHLPGACDTYAAIDSGALYRYRVEGRRPVARHSGGDKSADLVLDLTPASANGRQYNT